MKIENQTDAITTTWAARLVLEAELTDSGFSTYQRTPQDPAGRTPERLQTSLSGGAAEIRSRMPNSKRHGSSGSLRPCGFAFISGYIASRVTGSYRRFSQELIETLSKR
jgi:hypothetical protein